MADQVPFGVFQFTKRYPLAFEFLHPVLAEHAQAGGVGFFDPLRFYGFADPHERNIGFISAAALTSVGYPLTELIDCFLQHEASLAVAGRRIRRKRNMEIRIFERSILQKS